MHLWISAATTEKSVLSVTSAAVLSNLITPDYLCNQKCFHEEISNIWLNSMHIDIEPMERTLHQWVISVLSLSSVTKEICNLAPLTLIVPKSSVQTTKILCHFVKPIGGGAMEMFAIHCNPYQDIKKNIRLFQLCECYFVFCVVLATLTLLH